MSDDILSTTAESLWTRGRIADRDKNYWAAVTLLAEATKSRPDQFKSAADEAYRKAVFSRHLASLPNNTVIIDTTSPTYVLTEAISGRVFFNSSAAVKDRVLKGFQAALVADWPIVRAQFNETLRLEPGNANLKSFADLAGSGDLRASRRQLRVNPGVDMANQQLPQVFDLALLKTHMAYIQSPMIVKALTDILVGLYRAPVA